MTESDPVPTVQYAPVKPTNGMATAGFVLSFFTLIPFFGFAIFIMSAVFCGIGWRRANREGRSGKGLAIAGLVINFLTLLLSIVIVSAILNA